MNINEIRLSGKVIRDAQRRNERAPIEFTIAQQQRGGKATEFFSIICWHKNVDMPAKGELIEVRGSLRQNVWKDKDGNEKRNYRVVAEEMQKAQPLTPAGAFDKNLHGLEITDEDIPF